MTDRDLAVLLRTRFPGALIDEKDGGDGQVLHLIPGSLSQVGEFLRDEPEAQYELLVTLTDVRDHVHYQLVSLSRRRRLGLRVARSPSLDSLALVWPAANWSERETSERCGVTFVGHPNMAPLLLHPTEPSADRSGTLISPGVRFPASHEGWYVWLDLDGERVLSAQPLLGYRHVGLEKRLAACPYRQGTLLAARMDGFSAMHADLAYALAVEELLGVVPPARAQQWRIIYAELQRIASHLCWLARYTRKLSGPTLAAPAYAWRGRQPILDLFQRAGGNPITPDLISIGGLCCDPPAAQEDAVRDALAGLQALLDDLDTLLTFSAAFRSHQEGIGIIDPGTALGLGATGPCLRACGIDYDVRLTFPYSGYDALDVESAVVREGDSWARYQVRMADMRTSLDIVWQVLGKLESGSVNCFARGSLPANLPPGTAYASVEGARGELGIYLVSDGTDRLARAHVRAPSYANLSLLPLIARSTRIDHVSTILDSLDISIAEVER